MLLLIRASFKWPKEVEAPFLRIAGDLGCFWFPSASVEQDKQKTGFYTNYNNSQTPVIIIVSTLIKSDYPAAGVGRFVFTEETHTQTLKSQAVDFNF